MYKFMHVYTFTGRRRRATRSSHAGALEASFSSASMALPSPSESSDIKSSSGVRYPASSSSLGCLRHRRRHRHRHLIAPIESLSAAKLPSWLLQEAPRMSSRLSKRLNLVSLGMLHKLYVTLFLVVASNVRRPSTREYLDSHIT